MIRGLFVFVLALAVWCAALWLLIAPDFSQWQLPELTAAHALPPIASWGVWQLWRRRARRREAAAAAGRESAADKERQVKQDEARAQHALELQRLRYACDCRVLALAQVAPAADSSEPLVPEGDAISFSGVAAEAASDPEGALPDHLRPGIAQALGAIYTRCPAAAAFPIYVSPPADCVGETVVSALREVRAGYIAKLSLPVQSAPDFDQVLFLPSRDSAADSVIALFEANAELPAAVILAFDSPQWRERLQEDDDRDSGNPLQTEQRKWHGNPGQGVFALFMTNAQLPQMLAATPRSHAAHDALTPYWEKDSAAAASPSGFLAALSDEDRDELQRLPTLARVHRAASTRFGVKPPRSMEFARVIEALVERAQLHAALIDLPFDPAEATADARQASSEEDSAADCSWLVHNAGGIDRAGNRLAALGVALLKRGLDLDPIDAATNVTVKAGDLGQARSVAMLALTVARAASGEGAALCAEFHGDDGLALFFASAPEGSAA